MDRRRRTAMRAGTAALAAVLLLWPCQGPAQHGLPAAPPPAGAESYINFSFDQVDVGTFVKLVGDITGRKFVLGEGVKGKITTVSPKVSREDIYPLFISVLESAGCSIVKEGDIHRVVPLPERATPAAPVVGVDEETPAQGVVTKILRLRHVSAAELRKVLESKVRGGKTGALAAIEETNHLLITDTAESVRSIEKIVAEIDQPGLARVTEIVPLNYAGAESLAGQLNMAIAEGESRADRLRRRLPQVPGQAGAERREATVVPAPHSNSLILVGTTTQLEDLKQIIEKMDVDAPSGRGRLNAIFLKYLTAEEVAKSINGLLENPPAQEGGTQPQRRSISIQPSEANNALLVDAMPGDFEIVKRLVDQLDQAPQQVHITVIIAEVSVSDELTLGVEMAALEMPGEVGKTTLQGSSLFNNQDADSLMTAVAAGLFPRGLSFGVAHGTSLDADGNVVASFPGLINLEAIRRDARFEILSETSLEAQNNREATLSIVDDIPLLTSVIEGGSGTARDVIQNIERLDVGIKLSLTPHIIPDGKVQMVLNPSIEAVIGEGPADTPFTPTIAKREISTTVTVPDGKMIVIAGLTRKDTTESEERVPILGDIPILGMLFRRTVDVEKKTDLLIFVTPRIVSDMAVADSVRREWEQKTGLPPNENE